MQKVSGPCLDDHCDRPAVTRAGFCLRCYKRWKRRGTTHMITTEERFFSHVTQAGDCWEWAAFRQPNSGYGKFWLAGHSLLAHRWAYEFLRGGIPEGLSLDHECRNTACVNPWHLDPVTDRVNVVVRGTGISAQNARKTHCIRNHEFTAENTYFTPKRGRRQCRRCARIREMK